MKDCQSSQGTEKPALLSAGRAARPPRAPSQPPPRAASRALATRSCAPKRVTSTRRWRIAATKATDANTAAAAQPADTCVVHGEGRRSQAVSGAASSAEGRCGVVRKGAERASRNDLRLKGALTMSGWRTADIAAGGHADTGARGLAHCQGIIKLHGAPPARRAAARSRNSPQIPVTVVNWSTARLTKLVIRRTCGQHPGRTRGRAAQSETAGSLSQLGGTARLGGCGEGRQAHNTTQRTRLEEDVVLVVQVRAHELRCPGQEVPDRLPRGRAEPSRTAQGGSAGASAAVCG